MKGLKKRVLSALCVVAMLTGVIWQGGLQQVANAAEESNTDFSREWEIIGADDEALTVVDTSASKRNGSITNCNIQLPEDISEGNLALYVKLNVEADASALELLNQQKNTYIELCNVTNDAAERNWEIGFAYGLKTGENELVLRFDESSYHNGTGGKDPFDYRETINFFRFYTGNNNWSTENSCKVEVTELRVVYTDAGLEFGQDDTYLQLSNTLSENPTTIEASIKKDVIEPEATEWTLAKSQTKTLNNQRLVIENTYDITIPEKYVTTTENLAESKLAISFELYCPSELTIGDGQFELNSSGANNDSAEIRYMFKNYTSSLVTGWNEIVLPISSFSVAGDVVMSQINYMKFYTGTTGLTGEYKFSDIKLVVLSEEETTEWTLGKAGENTPTGFSVGTTMTGDEPGAEVVYEETTLENAKLNLYKSVSVDIPEQYQISTSELTSSKLAVAFWFYSSNGVDLGAADGRFQLKASSGTGNETIRYMLRDLKTFSAGWHYIVLPLRLFVVNEQVDKITNFSRFCLYDNGITGTFRVSDVKLLVLEEDSDTEWTIADGFIYDSHRNSGEKYSFIGRVGYMGTVQASEAKDGLKEGVAYADATLANQKLLFARTLTNPIPEKYKLNSVEDRLTSKLAVSLWMYSSVDTTLNDGQLELTSSSARNDDHEIRYNMGKHPITLKVGWNYIEMPLNQFDYTDDSSVAGTLDVENLNYLYFYDNTTRSQTIRITDIKMMDTAPETVVESEYASADTNEMIFSNTGANDVNQTALMVTEEGYLVYVEGTTQYTLEQSVCTGNWVDVAVVRDTEKIIFYIDGEEAGYCSTSARTDTAPNAKHSIGADGTGNQLFNGSICDVRIWNDVRTADEIKNNLVDKNTVALTSNNLDMTDESLIGSWFLVGDIQYVLDTMPDNAGGNHAVFCGSRANDWIDYDKTKHTFLYDTEGKENYWSMVFIPDIQNLVTGKYTKLWYDMADWIATNVKKENIQHVIGAGDSTWSNQATEYTYARNGFDKFTSLVSWSNMIGNHDYVWNSTSRDSANYNTYFGTDYITSTYANYTYQESYEDEYGISGTENSYYTFNVNGEHWMILQLEYYPRQEVLNWANTVIESHPKYNVIVTTHSYLDGSGNYATDSMSYTSEDAHVGGSLGVSTEAIWDNVIKSHDNVKMILCGHSTNGEGTIVTKTVANGANQDVTALMMNAQDKDMTDENSSVETEYYTGQGLGMLSILRFSADGSQVAVQYYAPGYDKSYDAASNDITLSYETESCEPFISEKQTGVNAGKEPNAETLGVPEGYVFVGWFTNPECTNALAAGSTNAEAYAKYVSAEVFSVKAQVSLLEDREADLYRDIRFVTSVDSLNYSEVGFRITINGEERTFNNPTVYKKLYGVSDTKTVLDYVPNQAICDESEYFNTWTIFNVPYKAYDTPIYVQPYWKTLDGTEVRGETVSKNVARAIIDDDTNNLSKVTTYGRTILNEEESRELFWTNSGFSFKFTGTGATATISATSIADGDYGYLNVYVDGALVPTKTIRVTSKENAEYVLAEGLEKGTHTIEVRKRNEAIFGDSATITIASLEVAGGKFVEPKAVSDYTIEVIGDSITSGYGNMVTDKNASFTTDTEEGTMTYAVLAAKQLGADVSILSRSGIGFCRGTNVDSFYNYYTQTAALPRNVKNSSSWDFEKNETDVVVINLGTNDNNATKDGVTISDEYVTSEAVAFIQLVRANNPNAIIIWTYGMMGNTREAALQTAVEQINNSGDEKVYYLSLDEINEETEGIGAASHPTIQTHINRSKDLAQFIADKTGWTIDETLQQDVLTGTKAYWDALNTVE